MKLKLAKTAGFLFACGTVLFAAQGETWAQGVSSGVLTAISSYMHYSGEPVIVEADAALTGAGQTEDTTICGYSNLGIAHVETNLNIREAADETADLVGKLPKDAGCEILDTDGDWYHIRPVK